MKTLYNLTLPMLLLLVSLSSPCAFAQQKGRIVGLVTTSDGKPASSATVSVEGIKRGTVAADDGSFAIHGIKPGSYWVIASYLGSAASKVLVEVEVDKQSRINLVLPESKSELAAVIVKSYKSANKKPIAAGKMAVPAFELPQSVAVIGQETIQAQQSLRLSDVVKNVNGVYLGTSRGSTQETFYARGYSFGSNNMFKNGSRVNTGAMPEVSSLERVEVLKGSAAILYGNVAPGGVLNMVTKQPKFTPGAEISVRAGSYDLYKPSVDFYGPLSSKIAYRVNGTYEKANSFRNSVHSSRYYVNPSLLFKLDDKTELIIQGDYLKHDFTPDFGVGAINNRIAELPRNTFLGTSWSYATTQQATASAVLNHELNKSWNFNFIASYQDYGRNYYSTERVQPDSAGNWVRPLNRSNTLEDYYTGQLNFSGKVKTGRLQHTLLLGTDADHYLNQSYAYNQPTVYDTINILDLSRYQPRTDKPAAEAVKRVSTPTNRFGVYANDLITVSKKINVLLGLRWSYQQGLAARTTDLMTEQVTKGTSKDDKAFSPRVGVVYKPAKNTALFASYANSFSVNTGTDIYGNILKPSLIDQFELGVKNDLFGGLMSANLTVYRIVNNNLAQTAQYLADGVTVNTNPNFKELTGQTTSDGLEVDLSGHPIPGLDLLGGYSYNFMRYTRTLNASGNYIEGERLVNSPAHTANLSAFYTIRNSRLAGLKLGAQVNYVGSRFGGWNNKIGQVQQESRLIPVSGFTTADLSAGYSFRKLSFLFKVSNLGNVLNYYVHENYSINPIPPRQFATSIAYKF